MTYNQVYRPVTSLPTPEYLYLTDEDVQRAVWEEATAAAPGEMDKGELYRFICDVASHCFADASNPNAHWKDAVEIIIDPKGDLPVTWVVAAVKWFHAANPTVEAVADHIVVKSPGYQAW